MGFLVNLSFKSTPSPQRKFVSLSPTDKTVGDIVKKIGLQCVNPDTIDLDTPVLVVTNTVRFDILIGTYSYKTPLDLEYVEECARKNGIPTDTLIAAEFPMFQESIFPYEIEDIGGNKSRISFTTVPESAVREVLATLPDLLKK